MRRVALLLLLVLVGGCSSSKGATPVTVFAAASLTDAFSAVSRPDGHATFNFAGSQALVTQIEQGAPADVFASADEKNMQKLVDAGLVESPRAFARNALQIAVAPGNPKHVAGLGDLA